MQHPDVWLVEYYDHELPPGRCRQVESHLADCAVCRGKLEDLRLLSRTLAGYSLPERTIGAERFRSQVVLRLPRRQAVDGQRTGWLWWAVPVSLVCVMVSLLGLFALPQLALWVVSIARWSGLGGQMAALLPSVVGLEGVLGDWGSILMPMIGIAWQMLLGVLLVLVFLPYVGWVGVLVRAHRHSDVLKGGTRGPL